MARRHDLEGSFTFFVKLDRVRDRAGFANECATRDQLFDHRRASLVDGAPEYRGVVLLSIERVATGPTRVAEIGRQRLFHSLMEEALLSLSRGLGYIESQLGAKLEAPVRAQLDRIKRDIESLSAHETRLSDKIQFLLDASLGLIAIEQNDIFKVLTVVSVIGIPPTLIASMYGMNFKTIPEYDWPYGYAYGLCLIVLTGLTPYLWFRWKRWI